MKSVRLHSAGTGSGMKLLKHVDGLKENCVDILGSIIL
jgi:hypothetical protein